MNFWELENLNKKIVEPLNNKWVMKRIHELLAEMYPWRYYKRHHNIQFAHGKMTEGFRK